MAGHGEAIDLTSEAPVRPSQKRKAPPLPPPRPSKKPKLQELLSTPSSSKASAAKTNASASTPRANAATKKVGAARSPSKKPKEKEEKRLRRFREKAPQSFHDIHERALGQRFYVLARHRFGSEECPGESFEMTGSTGNIYAVHIDRKITCSCPHAVKGNQCKHMVYILARVLHAPTNCVYQLGLLSSELREIFAAAPAASNDASSAGGSKRKPIEDDCPICFSELHEPKPDAGSKSHVDGGHDEAVVWCAAACGQNFHQQCFETWARAKAGGDVTCPMCRAVWKGDDDLVSRVSRERGEVTEEGYVNVASQLGISGVRDESTYSEWYGRSSRDTWGSSYNRRRRSYW